jgi:hypothetical protein
VLVIPAAHLLGVLNVWLVLTVMPLVSLLNQFVYPAGTAALPRIVDEDDLTAANSLFSMTYQGAELVFNAVAGVVVVAAFLIVTLSQYVYTRYVSSARGVSLVEGRNQ